MEIVHGDGGARFGEAIAVGDRDAEVVEELQRLRLAEGAADYDGAQFSAEIVVDLFQQQAAEAESRLALRQRLVDGNERVEDFALAWRQCVEACLQPLLQILQDERNEADVGDFVFREGFADEFGPQCPQDARLWRRK